MKPGSLLSLLLSFFSLLSANAQQEYSTLYFEEPTIDLKNDTILRNKLADLDFNQFIGNPLSFLEQNDTISLYKDSQASSSRPFISKEIHLKYAEGLKLVLYVQKPLSKKNDISHTFFYIYGKDTVTAIKFEHQEFDRLVEREKTIPLK